MSRSGERRSYGMKDIQIAETGRICPSLSIAPLSLMMAGQKGVLKEMTLFITDKFRAAFGHDMNAQTMKAIDGALEHGMREEAVIMAIYHTQSDVEEGNLDKHQTLDERVVERLRNMYRSGLR